MGLRFIRLNRSAIMDWMKFTVHTTTIAADLISEILMSAGAAGTEIKDRYDVLSSKKKDGMWDMIDEDVLSKMSEDTLVLAYFEADGSQDEKVYLAKARLDALKGQDLGFDLGSLKMETDNVRDEDWQENWKQYYKPMKIGSSIVIKPTWENYEAQEGDLVLEMDPGMAFGTGTHETTSMCIEMLDDYIQKGCDVIDVGTGSGILALAAAKLGAGKCLAIDLDALAVKVAKENVEHNCLEDKVTVIEGDLLDQSAESADVIVANIIADVICFLARPAAAKLKKNGIFICSGIILEKEADVLNALIRAGYEVCKRRQKGEWVCLAAHLRA